MENKINELKSIYEYTFSINNIKIILQEIVKELQLNLAKLVETANTDYNNLDLKINVGNLINIAFKISNEEILEMGKITGKEIIDGIGNIGVVYNGTPEITLKTVLTAIKTHNNIVLIPKNKFETNKLIIKIIIEVLKRKNYYNGIIFLEEKYGSAHTYENFFDKILFVGDKFEYIKLRKLIEIPIEYNNYGYISLIADTYNPLVESIKMYCMNNYINLDYYDSDIEEAIESINLLNTNQTVAIFSNNQKNIINIVLKLKSNDIYINKNPLINYEFTLKQDSFINRKILKSKT